MITRLTGKLESIDGNVAVVAVANLGIAHEVLIPAYLSQRLRATHALDTAARGVTLDSIDAQVTFHTLEYLEGQGQGTSFIPRLLGFATPAERDFFDLLTTVKGLGNKRTLRALAVEPGLVVRAIIERDIRGLQELPEIGKKLAETIILELREKAQKFVDRFGAVPSRAGAGGAGADDASSGFIEGRFPAHAMEAISAIVNLGEPEPVAERMVSRALRNNPALTSADELISAAYASRGP